MSSLSLMLLVICSLVVLLLLFVLVLVVLLLRQSALPLQILQALIKDQQKENQSLRNQLRSPDPQTLAGLNYATLPSTETGHLTSDPIGEPVSLTESIDFEDALSRQGYSLGDLGHDLESAGWSQPIIRRGDDDPIAYDPS